MHACQSSRRSFVLITFLVALAMTVPPLFGFGESRQTKRFGDRVKTRSGGVIGSTTSGLDQLDPSDLLRQDWIGKIAMANEKFTFVNYFMDKDSRIS